jgi:hypothetical protein
MTRLNQPGLRPGLRLLGVCAVALLSAVSSLPQSVAGARAKTTEITFFAGISSSVNPEKGQSLPQLQVNASSPYGGRIAYNFTEDHAVEFTVANPPSIHANYVYNFAPIQVRPKAKFVLYLTAGVGGSRYGVELRDSSGNLIAREEGPDRHTTAFTANFGGGLKYHLTGRLAPRFDARDVVGRYQATFANVLGVTGGIVRGRQTYNDLQLTGGIVFVFGGR